MYSCHKWDLLILSIIQSNPVFLYVYFIFAWLFLCGNSRNCCIFWNYYMSMVPTNLNFNLTHDQIFLTFSYKLKNLTVTWKFARTVDTWWSRPWINFLWQNLTSNCDFITISTSEGWFFITIRKSHIVYFNSECRLYIC